MNSGNYTDDIDDQDGTTFDNDPDDVNTNNNYGYDDLGNLIRDDQEKIANIEWTVYGKIKSVTRIPIGTDPTSTAPDLEFGYDASGNRLWKKVKPKPLNSATEKIYYYLRDAQGNEMAFYQKYTDPTNGLTYKLEEHSIYACGRLGTDGNVKILYTSGAVVSYPSDIVERNLGEKKFELTNQLGNVLVTITDKKIYLASSGTVVAFDPEITSITDYYPFGSVMTGRTYSNVIYRFGFNGGEKEIELIEITSFEYRLNNTALGRWMSVDPLMGKYPGLSPFNSMSNCPISLNDPRGLSANQPTEDAPNAPQGGDNGSSSNKPANSSDANRNTSDPANSSTSSGGDPNSANSTSNSSTGTAATPPELKTFKIMQNIGETDWEVDMKNCAIGSDNVFVYESKPCCAAECAVVTSYKSFVASISYEVDVVVNGDGTLNVNSGVTTGTDKVNNGGNHAALIDGAAKVIPTGDPNIVFLKAVTEVANDQEDITVTIGIPIRLGPVQLGVEIPVPTGEKGTLVITTTYRLTFAKNTDGTVSMKTEIYSQTINAKYAKIDENDDVWFTGDVNESEWQINSYGDAVK